MWQYGRKKPRDVHFLNARFQNIRWVETFVDQMALVKNDDGAIAAAVAVAVAAAVVDDDNFLEEGKEEPEVGGGIVFPFFLGES